MTYKAYLNNIFLLLFFKNFTNNFDPVAFTLFALEIRWYSLAYIFGILFGWFYCKKFLIRDKIISSLFDDLVTYLIIGIIVGEAWLRIIL